MKRRDFIKNAGLMATSLFTDKLNGLTPDILMNKGPTANTQDWKISEHYKEWIESSEYDFLYPENDFLFPERITLLTIPQDIYYLQQQGPEKPPLRNTIDPEGVESSSLFNIFSFAYPDGFHYASLSLCPTKKTDFVVFVGEDHQNLHKNGKRYYFRDAEGFIDLLFPIEQFDGNRVFYQVFYSQDKGKARPLSPIRAFKHPKNNYDFTIYARGDDHPFDDRFDLVEPLTKDGSSFEDGIRGHYYKYFLKNAIEDPYWGKNADKFDRELIRKLTNTYHAANTAAWFIKSGVHPDAIIRGGDETGIEGYRCERQGYTEDEFEKMSWDLTKRHRRYDGTYSPLTHSIWTIGNHDGDGKYCNPADEYAKETRMTLFKQPGSLNGSAPEENYFVIPLGGGRFEIICLDIITHSGGEPNYPCRPEHHRFGEEQNKWVEQKLERSDALFRIISKHRTNGWPFDPKGKEFKGYGRGGEEITKEYYLKLNEFLSDLYPPDYPPIDVDALEDPKLTEKIKGSSGKTLSQLFHDHVSTEMLMIDSNHYAKHVGSINEVREENIWKDNLCWIRDYGKPCEFKYINSPTMEEINIYNEGQVEIKTICTSFPDPNSNLNRCGVYPKIGDVVRSEYISF